MWHTDPLQLAWQRHYIRIRTSSSGTKNKGRESKKIAKKEKPFLSAAKRRLLERGTWINGKKPDAKVVVEFLWWQGGGHGCSFYAVAGRERGSNFQICGFYAGIGFTILKLSDLERMGARVNNHFQFRAAKELGRRTYK